MRPESAVRIELPDAYIVEMDHFIHEKYDFRLLCIRLDNMVMTCRLDEQVDAIVFAPHVTPLRET